MTEHCTQTESAKQRHRDDGGAKKNQEQLKIALVHGRLPRAEIRKFDSHYPV
jgi:hypothetical protein